MAKRYFKLSKILSKLLFDKRISPSQLAKEVELPSPTIHRLVTGKSTRPYRSSLEPIAKYFSITIDQLLGEEPLFLDNNNQSQLYKLNHISNIPLIPWEYLDARDTSQIYQKIPFMGEISDVGFASVMPDTSMEPIIQRNSIIIFDPIVKPTDRSYALVKLYETRAYVLRQILVDADHQYLKPLNPDLSAFKMRFLNKLDVITACLIETRHNFQPGSITNHKEV